MGKIYSGRLWIWIRPNTIDRHGTWQMQRVYGVGGKLLKAVQNFYVDSLGARCIDYEVKQILLSDKEKELV